MEFGQASGRVEDRERHLADVQWRVGPLHVAVSTPRDEGPRARAVPEDHRFRPQRREILPSVPRARRGVDVPEVIFGDSHAAGCGSRRSGVSKLCKRFLRAIGEGLGRLRNRNAIHEQHALIHQEHDDEGHSHPRGCHHRVPAAHRVGHPGGSDHRRRWRFAGGKRRRERIASRK